MRGAAQYPPAWAEIGDRPLYEADVDLGGALADRTAHLSVVRDRAVPLPEPPAALLVEIAERPDTAAADTPPAALRAADILERTTTRAGRAAAGKPEGGVSAETVATALGTTRSAALVMLLTAQDG